VPVREYSGSAKATSLTGAVTAGATVINVADATGWPTGAVGPFVVTIDAGVTTEEKVLVSGRTGNSLTVQTRGFDGTTASDHGNAASVQHTISAADIREANAHVNDSTGDPHPQYLTPTEGAALYSPNAHGHNYADPAHSHTYESITLKPALEKAYVQAVAFPSLGVNVTSQQVATVGSFTAPVIVGRRYHVLVNGSFFAQGTLRSVVRMVSSGGVVTGNISAAPVSGAGTSLGLVSNVNANYHSVMGQQVFTASATGTLTNTVTIEGVTVGGAAADQGQVIVPGSGFMAVVTDLGAA